MLLRKVRHRSCCLEDCDNLSRCCFLMSPRVSSLFFTLIGFNPIVLLMMCFGRSAHKIFLLALLQCISIDAFELMLLFSHYDRIQLLTCTRSMYCSSIASRTGGVRFPKNRAFQNIQTPALSPFLLFFSFQKTNVHTS